MYVEKNARTCLCYAYYDVMITMKVMSGNSIVNTKSNNTDHTNVTYNDNNQNTQNMIYQCGYNK